MTPQNHNFDLNTKNVLACVTLNNLGCLYKKLNLNLVANKHFMLVLKLEENLGVPTTSLVNTMLNISASLSN